ncbi:MAG: hypothetical protein RML46_12860 [Anaerolineae bacterium]|nr:hypothetical protein [Anaerolineae bacterium]MDW8069784.1 hypothetical protein [Anaerolineae bacterium]
MPDRVFAQCPHCGQPNAYSRTELEETQPGAKVWRSLRPPRPPEPQEYVVTCQYCHRAFKIVVE